MADITMCLNEKCHLKEICYRFTAIPNEYMQSYGTYEPDDKGNCENLLLR